MSVSSKFVPVVCPISILSKTDVKIIGFDAVPIAIIFEPLATIKADEFVPEPSCPLIIVPASILSDV